MRKKSAMHAYLKDYSLLIAQSESNAVVSFFKGINLVNNPKKACVIYNSKGKGEQVTIENIGGATLTSKIVKNY